MSELLKTPLYQLYKDEAKTINFGGWDLPVEFSSIKKEHMAVRTKAGLFDVSHMGEFLVTGEGALPFLQKLMTNDVSKLETNQVQYTAMCYEDGGTVDDLLVYRRGNNDYLLVVNAANIKKDFEWMNKHIMANVQITNVSDEMAQLALQGPLAKRTLQAVTTFDLSDIGFFRFENEIELAGVKALVSRTGYTGEDGFEMYCQSEDAAKLWTMILEVGKAVGVIPCGLGARDTLRFEAKLPLYGQELSSSITPVEAGIGFVVKTDKQVDFFGKQRLKQQKEVGPKRKIVGIEMIEKGIPRPNYDVFKDDQKIGVITTGTQSPTLKKNIGLAILDGSYTALDTEVNVQVRKKRLKAKVVKTPFYKRPMKGKEDA